MIQSRKDLKEYLNEDKKVNKINNLWTAIRRPTWRYIRYMRYTEYYTNIKSGFFAKLLFHYYNYKLSNISIKTGIQIPPNTFGKGLYVPHYGSIVVNSTSRFGDYCVVQNGVNISDSAGGGNFIYIGTGAKIMRNVKIADYVIIGANAVVTKDITEEDIVVAGVPAKKISENGRKNRSVI